MKLHSLQIVLGSIGLLMAPCLSHAASLEDAIVDHMAQVHRQDQKSGAIAHRDAAKAGPVHATAGASVNSSSANRVATSKKQQNHRKLRWKRK